MRHEEKAAAPGDGKIRTMKKDAPAVVYIVLRYTFPMGGLGACKVESRGGRLARIQDVVSELAGFRYELRKFLRFSERAARECGVTPQQHQLMLGVAGFTGSGSATVSELAEFLQERHNSVVGLIERAARKGIIRREQGEQDRRQVVVSLTIRGEEILAELSALHYDELTRMRAGFLRIRAKRPRLSGKTGGRAGQPKHGARRRNGEQMKSNGRQVK